MRDKKRAEEVIRTLEGGGFFAECPCCDERVSLRECSLFYLDDFNDEAREIYGQYLEDLKARRLDLRERRQHISKSSQIQAQATNVGFILERLAPSLSSFGFECGDCRSLFDPIDYVIFEGLCRGGRVSRIIFADIKTGGGRLSSRQREIRALVQQKKVEFDVYEAKR
jgi:predicted Holliday junction resolvase-like endonuclease